MLASNAATWRRRRRIAGVTKPSTSAVVSRSRPPGACAPPRQRASWPYRCSSHSLETSSSDLPGRRVKAVPGIVQASTADARSRAAAVRAAGRGILPAAPLISDTDRVMKDPIASKHQNRNATRALAHAPSTAAPPFSMQQRPPPRCAGDTTHTFRPELRHPDARPLS